MQHVRPTGAEVKAARTAAKLTQTQAAELVYCDLRSWQNWEYEAGRMPAAKWELFQIKVAAMVKAAD